MNINQLRERIISKRDKGESYRRIASKLGLEPSMVRYIETHENYKPSKRMVKILNLDPEPSLAYARTRNQKLDEIARSWGYSGWCAYGTAMIKEYEECQNTTQS